MTGFEQLLKLVELALVVAALDVFLNQLHAALDGLETVLHGVELIGCWTIVHDFLMAVVGVGVDDFDEAVEGVELCE